MEERPASITPPTSDVLKHVRVLLALTLRSMMKRQAYMDGLVEDDFLRLIHATEGMALMGDREPIMPDQRKSYRRVMRCLKAVETLWLKTDMDETIERARKDLRGDAYLRSHTKTTIVRPVAESVSEFISQEVPEVYRAPKRSGTEGISEK